MLLTTEWTITDEWKNTPEAEIFSSLKKVFELEGRIVAADSESCVFPFKVGDRRYYVKRYHATKGLRSYLGWSRIKVEWENQLYFLKLGLPAAKVVAYGQERILSKTQRGVLITEALEGTIDLAELARNGSPLFRDRKWVEKISCKVAHIARTLHRNSFVHNDFKWRNILITPTSEPEAFLIDCPAGQKWHPPFLEYRIVKDLACLDKVAKYQLTRTQRLRFLLEYHQSNRLTPKIKQQARKVVRFFEGRE
ncbi:lipopolysaccharide kinase InaA family protein [Endozoicomonadaceae bacterium StTr2]